MGEYFLGCEGNPRPLFNQKDTNNERIFGPPNASAYVKDGINNYVAAGRLDTVNPNQAGTKAAAHYQLNVAAGVTSVIRLWLGISAAENPFSNFNQIIDQRRHEADEFYRSITPVRVSEDAANVMRQGLSGMLWSK